MMGSRLLEGLDNHIVLSFLLPITILSCLSFKVLWSLFHSPGERPQNSTIRSNVNTDDYDCPICMDPPSFMVETNCGHRFCAQCFISHWKRTIYSRVISCPMCRGHVRLLNKLFTESEIEQIHQTPEIGTDLNRFNRWYSGEYVSIFDRLKDVPAFMYGIFQLLISGEGTFTFMQIRLTLLGVLVFIYLISPFDFIPECITGFLGVIDDFLVLFMYVIHVISVYRTISARQNVPTT